jgi:hypothetical protein
VGQVGERLLRVRHTLCYRYKANGVQRLALNAAWAARRSSRRIDVSGLNLDPKASARISASSPSSAGGPYGLFEAVDFTPTG